MITFQTQGDDDSFQIAPFNSELSILVESLLNDLMIVNGSVHHWLAIKLTSIYQKSEI